MPRAPALDLLFIDAGGLQESYFTWSNAAAGSPFSKLDVIAARSFPGAAGDYIHLKRKGHKLAFRLYPRPSRGSDPLLLVAGAAIDCQYQLMEAYLDFLRDRWFERFPGHAGTSGGPKVFESFAAGVALAFEVVPRDLVRAVPARCPACGQYYDVLVKKALVDAAESSPVPLVFEHGNHALLLYIDKDYRSRGESVVTVTG